MYDLAIIGGGPGGTAAGVYASRKHLKTVFITKEWGGQSVVSTDIQNWIGTTSISGTDLAKNLQTHLETYANEIVDIVSNTCVTSVEKIDGGYKVSLDNNESHEAKTLLVTAGAHRRKLKVLGAKEFDQKGLTYCASCDGPLFSGQDVVVIGGGNAGFETAAQLLAYAKSVTLLNRSDAFKADPVTVKKVLANEKMTALLNADISEVVGDKFVTAVKYKDTKTSEEKELLVTGVFVEIGLVPNTDFLGGLVELDNIKRIKVDPKTQKTILTNQTLKMTSGARHGESEGGDEAGASATEEQRLHNEADDVISGIWAAGDCADGLYQQNNIAVGDSIKALEDIYNHLHTK